MSNLPGRQVNRMVNVGWLTKGSEESEVLTQNGSSLGALFARRGHNREGKGEDKSRREETQGRARASSR